MVTIVFPIFFGIELFASVNMTWGTQVAECLMLLNSVHKPSKTNVGSFSNVPSHQVLRLPDIYLWLRILLAILLL